MQTCVCAETDNNDKERTLTGLVLSLFPGIGLLDMAFEEAGFCVVRGPDSLWGGDIRSFRPPSGRLDGVIGGPPCQCFSRLRHLVEANGYRVAENLIPEFERVVLEAMPRWFVMENVPDAPTPIIPGFVTQPELVRDVWVGGETNRMRRFTFGWRVVGNGCERVPNFRIETLALHAVEPELAVLASGGRREIPVAIGGSGKPKRREGRDMDGNYLAKALRLSGLPADFLDDAPFTVSGKIKVVGNGVPLPMGRAVAAAVSRALATKQAA